VRKARLTLLWEPPCPEESNEVVFHVGLPFYSRDTAKATEEGHPSEAAALPREYTRGRRAKRPWELARTAVVW
jgi:hypothetical protein